MDSVPSRVEDILLALINNTEYDGPIISRVEQILYSFLENSEYAADPESRVEAILVALKAAGLYDDEVISRIEKILYSKINGTEYAAEPESRVEELLLEWELSKEKELTGVVPLLFNADGTPLLDYLISGNEEHSGSPTPDNPIMPQSCGEKTGNLFDAETAYGNMYNDGVITGQAGVINNIKNQVSADMVGKTYTLSFTPLQIASRAYVAIVINGTSHWRENEIFVNQRASFIFTPETANDTWYISYDTGGVCSYEDFMLNSGSTPLPYEPYGYKIPISSANTTTPVYLGDVQSTRAIYKMAFDGTENIRSVSIGTGLAFIYIPEKTPNKWSTADNIVSSHFKSEYANNDGNIYFTTNRMVLINLSCATVEEFKQYLAQQYAAGTPVTVWYVLAEPETTVVNEPLMKIGDYADSISMEQAGVEIPTASGENTLDVLTTVKPSEVYIKYKGR